MTLNEHYKFHSRKSLKPYISLCIIMALCIEVFHTSARFVNATSIISSVYIANWSVLINGEQVSSGVNNLSRNF